MAMAFTKGAGSASAPADDSDLEDLIAKSPVGEPNTNLAIHADPYAPTSGGGGDFLGIRHGYPACGFVRDACHLFRYQFPRLFKCGLFLSFVGFASILSRTAVFNPIRQMGIFGGDYSAITSAYDLSLSRVDHWCVQGDSKSCDCEDPLKPASRSDLRAWNKAHRANVADVNLYRAVPGKGPASIDESTGKARPPIDVAFLGESVVEAMDGRWLGKRVARAINKRDGGREKEGPETRKKPDIGKVFERLFRKENGGPLEGVALGIAGDSTAHVLWRLQHDEMPSDFNPKVWWLVLGMNDLTRMQCSEEIVVLGVLRVVEEIRLRKPDAKIVINSLLPMINYQKEEAPEMADFADFRQDKAITMKEVDAIIDGTSGDRRKLRTNKEKKQHDATEIEGAELDAALEHQHEVFEAGDKRFHDRVFADMEKYHPKAAISTFVPMMKKLVMPPVWPSVHLINDKLKEYCQKHESISFFDATPIFAEDLGHGRHRLHEDLISPRGHPSSLGFALWENRIVGKLNKLIIEKERDYAEDQTQKYVEEVEREDPQVQYISPDTKVSSADEEGGDEGEHVSGNGEEHVSDGKENEPPKLASQPSRDDPPLSEEKEDGKGMDDAAKEEGNGNGDDENVGENGIEEESEEEEKNVGEKEAGSEV